jgi:Fe2+ or Zn2+ uptake regulation protein
MENDKFLKLTNTVYRVLEFFPESDPLKNRAKDKALAIMECLTAINETSGWASFQKEKIKVQLLEDIDILLGYLWIGKSQGWLNSVNCLIIEGEYERIKHDNSPVMAGQFDGPVTVPPKADLVGKEVEPKKPALISNTKLSDRQQKIIEFLGKNEKAQVMDLQKILSNITKRTIRRDLDELLAGGKILRVGSYNQVFYKINGIGQVQTS